MNDNERYWDCLDQAMEASHGGRTEEALQWLDEALKAHPHGAEAHNNLGVALADKGDLDGAIQAFLDGLAAKPTQAASHHNVAILLLQKGDDAAAVEHLQAALRLDPANAAARAELERLQSAAQEATEWVRPRLVAGVELVGPAPAPIERLQGRWRWHFLLRSGSSRALTTVCRALVEGFTPRGADVRLALDRDPVALL